MNPKRIEFVKVLVYAFVLLLNGDTVEFRKGFKRMRVFSSQKKEVKGVFVNLCVVEKYD